MKLLKEENIIEENCILYSLKNLLDYGDAINIIQADERNRISERKDVALFDYEAYHEAILNAFIHIING